MPGIKIVLGRLDLISAAGSGSFTFGRLNFKGATSTTKQNIATGSSYGEYTVNNMSANEVLINDYDFMDVKKSKL